MRDALDKVNRDIVFSLSQYGMGDSWKWADSIGEIAGEQQAI